MKPKIPIVIVSAIGILLLLSGCATTKGDWQKASRLNTIEAYIEFLSKHPQSEFTSQARVKIERLEWNQAERQDTIEAYQRFLAKYPKSELTFQAKERILELEWENAKKLSTIESYQKFLDNYPGSKFSSQAKETVEKLEWDVAKKESTVEAYEEFLRKYPSGKFTSQVQSNLQVLREIKHADTLNKLEALIKRYQRQKQHQKQAFLVEKLIKDLGHEDQYVRERAVLAMGKIRDPRAVGP